jgi:hypothetical protein
MFTDLRYAGSIESRGCAMSRLWLFLAAALVIYTAFPNSAEARHRRYTVHAAPVYATDFWSRCYVRRYSVWWLQMCPAQRMAIARGYAVR